MGCVVVTRIGVIARTPSAPGRDSHRWSACSSAGRTAVIRTRAPAAYRVVAGVDTASPRARQRSPRCPRRPAPRRGRTAGGRRRRGRRRRAARARTPWPRRCARPSPPASTWPSRPAPAPASRWPTSSPPIHARRRAKDATRRRLDRHDRAAAPARRPRPAPARQGAQAAAGREPDVRDPQGPPQLPVPAQAARRTHRRPRGAAVRPVRRSPRWAAQVQRLHEWADDHRDRRPRRAGARRPRRTPGARCRSPRASASARHAARSARTASPRSARAEAGEADIVVTNHALLAIDALEERPVLPEHDVVVVDEAHELVDRVTGGGHRRAHRRARSAITARRLRQARRPGPSPTGSTRRARACSMVLDDLPPGPLGRRSRRQRRARCRRSATPRARCRTALRASRAARGPERLGGGRKLRSAALEEVARHRACGCSRRSTSPTRPSATTSCGWTAVRRGLRGGRHTVLRVAPLWVGGLLRERLFGRSHDVLTSATLSLGGSFDALARQWGLPPLGRRSAGQADGATARHDPGTAPASWSGPRRRVAVRPRPQRHPLRRASALPPPGPRRPAAGLPRRDRRAGRGRRRPHARPVLLDARRQAGHRGAARPARDTAAVPGRRLHDAAGQAVRRGRGDLPVRHAVAVAGRGRARPVAVAA